MKHLPYARAERIADRIYQIVAAAVLNELSDPRLDGVRVTRVNVTPDLRVARINFHIGEGATEERIKDCLSGFGSSKGFLKRRIGAEVNLRFMPELEFFYDGSVDMQERIEALLDSIKKK